MEETSLTTLHSISEWEQNIQTNWRVSALPSRLRSQWEELKTFLVGATPTKIEYQDEFIWNPYGGNYTLKSGYNYLQNYNSEENWNLWIVVQKNECLPKIKFFTWSLLKGKILTMEKFKKNNFQGP